MTPAVKQLKARMIDREGNYKRGAMSRVSEYLDVNRGTIRRWFAGEWTPGSQVLARIVTLLKDRDFDMGAHRTGPAPRTILQRFETVS